MGQPAANDSSLNYSSPYWKTCSNATLNTRAIRNATSSDGESRVRFRARRKDSSLSRHMHLVLVLAIVGSFAICPASANPVEAATSPSTVVAASDPIARLLDRLSSSRAFWQNGLFPSLGLPGSASNEQVLSRVLELSSFGKGGLRAPYLGDPTGPYAG